MPEVQKPKNIAINNDPTPKGKNVTTFINFETSRIGPASFPKWIVRFLVLKIVADLVRYGFMHKADATRVKNGDFTPKRNLFRSAAPSTVIQNTPMVDDEARDIVYRMMDLALPHDKKPNKSDLEALKTLCERQGVRESDVQSVLLDVLDNESLQALGLLEKT